MDQPILRADARANRIRLIAAAHEVFRERGLDAEMKEIAERAGVGVATLYRNFATREDLVAAMAAEVQGRMQAILAEALGAPDAIDGLRHVLRSGFQMLDQYGYLMAVFHQRLHGEGSRDDGERHWAKEQQIIGPLQALVDRGIESGVFRAGIDAELVAYRILTSLLPPIYTALRQTRSLDEIVDRNVDLLLHGLVER
jgi:AcrR family transcriptional regulator